MPCRLSAQANRFPNALGNGITASGLSIDLIKRLSRLCSLTLKGLSLSATQQPPAGLFRRERDMGSPKLGELLVPRRPTLGYHLEGKRDAACTLARGMQIGVSLDSEG
jgi:hypothetical protein